MVNELAEQLRPVVMRLSRELRREVRMLGITSGQASLLFSIDRQPGVGVRELAAQEHVSVAGISRHTRGLVERGLIRREGNPSDGRRHGLYVTNEGKQIIRRIKSRRTEWLADRLRMLPEGDLEAIRGAITPLWRLLDGEPA